MPLYHGLVDPTPEALILLLLDDVKDLTLPFFVLGLLSIGKTMVQMLPPVVFAILAVEVALLCCFPQP